MYRCSLTSLGISRMHPSSPSPSQVRSKSAGGSDNASCTSQPSKPCNCSRSQCANGDWELARASRVCCDSCICTATRRSSLWSSCRSLTCTWVIPLAERLRQTAPGVIPLLPAKAVATAPGFPVAGGRRSVAAPSKNSFCLGTRLRASRPGLSRLTAARSIPFTRSSSRLRASSLLLQSAAPRPLIIKIRRKRNATVMEA
jgi:hypothetical protein